MAGKRRRRRRRRGSRAARVFILLLLIILAGATGLYAYGLEKSKGFFLPNTTVNGIDYSGMTAEQAEEKFKSTYAGRVLTIHELGGQDEQIPYEAVDYRFTTGDTFSSLIENQDYSLYFMAPYTTRELVTDQGFEFNEEKLAECVHSLNAISGEGIQDPVDAYITRAENGYTIIEAVDGNRLEEEKVFEAAKNAVNEGASEIDLSELNCYKKASLYADDPTLTAQLDFIKGYEEMVITVSMEGDTYVDLTKETFLDWMEFGEGSVTVNEDSVKSYTEGLATQYNTFKTTRQFTTTEGDTLTVGGGNYDNYGYILNTAETAPLILKALQSGKSQTVVCVWDKYALTRNAEAGNDFGSTYIEISLDQQHMWYYKEGQLFLDTPICSGEPTKERATPTGVMQILDKKTDHKMKGSYGSARAKFALWLTEGGILIHDASWRDDGDYGDDVYLYNGSHGCVNTPLDAVSVLYENVRIGIPVIIYDRDNRVPDPQNETYTLKPGEEPDYEEEDEDWDEEYSDEEYSDENTENYDNEESYDESYDEGGEDYSVSEEEEAEWIDDSE